MDLTSPKTIKEILVKYNASLSKGLGQNFLIDRNVLNKIITAADISKKDIVLEVGPGIGTLTYELAKKAKKVITVEKSQKMCEILKETLFSFKNIEIINNDILKITKLKIKNYKVVANLPYYVTSPVIRMFLEVENPPQEMILMVQKEVAQRICEKPPEMSLLSVAVQFYAKPKTIFYVSRNCFIPSPKVDSAVIKITPLTNPGKCPVFTQIFFKIVKAGFSQPRKQLANNLSKMLKLKKDQVENWLLKNNIKPSQRAETLLVEDWEKLTNSF